MDLLIRPKKLKGIVNIVPSKSYSHRAIIAASLADGISVIKNVLFSEDIRKTIDACKAMGAKIKEYSDYLEIKGTKRVLRKEKFINVGESGSTIRFFIPIMLTNEEEIEFVGENNLVNRPLDTYFDIFEEQNIKYEHPSSQYLPLKTKGGLKKGIYNIAGNISSQFITGLLFALPLLDGDSIVNITTHLESKAYVDLTLDILKKFGINIINNDYKTFIIKGNQVYKPLNYTIEGDFSQAAFFLGMGLLGNDVKLGCMNLDSLQGDKKIISDIIALGGEVNFQNGLLFAKTKGLKEAEIDLSQAPDLGPILSVISSLAKGEVRLYNAYRLRLKECDRITCMKEELLKLSAIVSETEDEMYFEGVDSFTSTKKLNSHNDHRIAMSLAVASTVCTNPIVIKNAECVKKSYPHFWEDFKKLGGDFDVITK